MATVQGWLTEPSRQEPTAKRAFMKLYGEANPAVGKGRFGQAN
jgi:hypothetical protein